MFCLHESLCLERLEEALDPLQIQYYEQLWTTLELAELTLSPLKAARRSHRSSPTFFLIVLSVSYSFFFFYLLLLSTPLHGLCFLPFPFLPIFLTSFLIFSLTILALQCTVHQAFVISYIISYLHVLWWMCVGQRTTFRSWSLSFCHVGCQVIRFGGWHSLGYSLPLLLLLFSGFCCCTS